MKTVYVDDEPLMIRHFLRLSEGISGFENLQTFQWAGDVLEYAETNPVELAILDISMPEINGIELAAKLRQINKSILIVFITAYDNYIRDANMLGADGYIVKPYTRNMLEKLVSDMTLLSARFRKSINIQTFGRFLVFKDHNPVPISGKPKEILALTVLKRGHEISNEELYSTIWEDREYDNIKMKVYYNALKRLKNTLAAFDISNLLISTAHGQLVNTSVFECDYYDYLDGKIDALELFNGEFMSEYSWGEEYIAALQKK